ncbi:hypothetical protein [Streptomyces sp. NPDC014894]|uniref:hypothetical protein n=1 Tax=unclassified Streptomyces TaxID=2593676 RepID=UPI0036FCDF0F
MTRHDPAPPVPRDPPDQQAPQENDPLDLPRPAAPDGGEESDLPEADEAGAGQGREGRSGSVHPEQPVPDEASG